jgi:hypothetical protein
LNVSLSTDDPLQFHFTKVSPLLWCTVVGHSLGHRGNRNHY